MPDLLRKILRSSSGHEAGGPGGPADLQRSDRTRRDTDLFQNDRDRDWVWKSAPIAMAVVDAEGVQDWNPACRALLAEAVGGSEMAWKRWLGASVARLMAMGSQKEVLSASVERSLSLEVRLGADSGRGRGQIVALREVTGQTGRNDDLADTVSTLTHELRTPLTSMKSSLNLILSGETGELSSDQGHFLGITLRNVDRLDRLVGDLLDVARADAGHLVLRKRQTDLGPLLHEAVTLQAETARQAGLNCDFAGIPDSFIAHVDPDKLIQIVSNVVGNAIKYTDSGGLVRFWLNQRPAPEDGLAWQLAQSCFLPLQTYVLVVEDNGRGMSSEALKQVFQPFHRVHDESTCQVPGSGLGLHITKGLVQAHGGNVSIASEPGLGTTVWIRLPRDGESERLLIAARRLSQMVAAMPGPDAARIMVLDVRENRHVERVSGMVRQFCRELPMRLDPPQSGPVQVSEVVEPAPGLCAVATNEPAALRAAWRSLTQSTGADRIQASGDWRPLAVQAAAEWAESDELSPNMDKNL